MATSAGDGDLGPRWRPRPERKGCRTWKRRLWKRRLWNRRLSLATTRAGRRPQRQGRGLTTRVAQRVAQHSASQHSASRTRACEALKPSGERHDKAAGSQPGLPFMLPSRARGTKRGTFCFELIVCVSRSACCESLLLMWGMHFLVCCVVQSLTFWVWGRRNLPKKFRKFLRESKHGGSVHATLAGRSVSV